MRINEFDKQITSSDLEALETFADRIFGKVGIDVEFTRHFLDRVNDERNGKQITASELTRLFKQEYKRWGQPIAQMGPDQEAVMKDLVTDINMPFALRWDRENEELDLIVKTVMRKPNFKTSNKEFPVESIIEDREDRTDVADRLADLANSQITGYFSSEDELHDFMYSELTSDEDYHDGGKTVDWAMGRVNDDVKAWIEESGSLDSYYEMMRAKEMAEEDGLDSRNLSYGVLMDYIKKARIERAKKNEGRGLYSMGGRSGLRHSPTIRSRTSSASFLPKAGKKPSLIKRIFSDEFTENDFKPHMMYKGDKKKIAKTNDEHIKLGNNGWSHDNPKTKKVDEDSQIWEWNKEDPNNPEVYIQGYGRLMLNQIEDSVVRKLAELTKMAERGDFEQIQKLLDRDVMQIMMKAVVDTKAELQATRKRGGPKSRGINKESILDVIGRSEIKELDLKEFTLTDVKDMVKKGWMARPTEKQWKELIKTYNKYKGNVTRKDLLDLGIATLGRKESVKEKQEKTDDELKAFDPKTARAMMMLKAKYPQADNILSALLADVENNEKDSDVADLSHEFKVEKLTKAVDILQKEINLLKRKKTNETGGVGKIVPGINTTVDVGPDEIKKQAAKFGNAVDKDGVPKKNLR